MTTETLPVLPASATDPLRLLLESLDGPQHALLADVLSLRIAHCMPSSGAQLDALEARVFVQSIRNIASLCHARSAHQHRASPFALDRTANLAQLAESQAERWDAYCSRYELEDEQSIARFAGSHSRATVLRELLAHLRSGDPRPFVPSWLDQDPPECEDAEDEADTDCPQCSGSGQGMWEGTRCVACHGTGQIHTTSDEA